MWQTSKSARFFSRTPQSAMCRFQPVGNKKVKRRWISCWQTVFSLYPYAAAIRALRARDPFLLEHWPWPQVWKAVSASKTTGQKSADPFMTRPLRILMLDRSRLRRHKAPTCTWLHDCSGKCCARAVIVMGNGIKAQILLHLCYTIPVNCYYVYWTSSYCRAPNYTVRGVKL